MCADGTLHPLVLRRDAEGTIEANRSRLGGAQDRLPAAWADGRGAEAGRLLRDEHRRRAIRRGRAGRGRRLEAKLVGFGDARSEGERQLEPRSSPVSCQVLKATKPADPAARIARSCGYGSGGRGASRWNGRSAPRARRSAFLGRGADHGTSAPASGRPEDGLTAILDWEFAAWFGIAGFCRRMLVSRPTSETDCLRPAHFYDGYREVSARI